VIYIFSVFRRPNLNTAVCVISWNSVFHGHMTHVMLWVFTPHIIEQNNHLKHWLYLTRCSDAATLGGGACVVLPSWLVWISWNTGAVTSACPVPKGVLFAWIGKCRSKHQQNCGVMKDKALVKVIIWPMVLVGHCTHIYTSCPVNKFWQYWHIFQYCHKNEICT